VEAKKSKRKTRAIVEHNNEKGHDSLSYFFTDPRLSHALTTMTFSLIVTRVVACCAKINALELFNKNCSQYTKETVIKRKN
jgi:ethanolamine utilization protein EutP (predicted NTPase)